MTVLFDITPAEHALDDLLAYKYPAASLSPTIHILDAALRKSHADELAALLRDMDQTRAAVAGLESRMKELFLRLYQRRAAVATAMAPVTGLPTELLREIFMHVAESDKTSKARIVLSHVSSTWREASLGLQELWTIIQVPRRCPEMMHEFASRSGDLRLELSALSKWPYDLKFGRDDASRLAFVTLASSLSFTSVSSLKRFKDFIHLDKLVVSSSGNIGDAETLTSESLEIQSSGFILQAPLRLDCLASLSIGTTYVRNFNSIFHYLCAPSLHELQITCIRAEPEPWSDPEDEDEDEDEEPERLSFGRFDNKIMSLSIVRCDLDVWFQICDHIPMPSLTSLTIVFNKHDVIEANALRSFSNLLKASQQLEHLDVAVRDIELSEWKVLWSDYYGVDIPVPKLRTFRLESLRYGDEKAEKYRGAKHLLHGMVARSKRFDVEPLRRFIVSRNMVREQDEEKLRECVEELILLDPLQPPTSEWGI